MIDVNLQLSDVLHHISQPIERTAVATISTSEEERSLENWSYEWNDVIYSTTQFYLIYNDTSNLWRYLHELNHTAEARDDWRAMSQAKQ